MDISSCYKIGYVAGTHGLKGEVTIVITAAAPITESQSIFVEINGRLIPHFIERISDRGDRAFVKFDDVSDPEGAKNLKGKSLYLPRSSRPAPARNEFYDDEVIGYAVWDETLGLIGTVGTVEAMGPNRLLSVIRLGNPVLIPVNSPFIKSLNRSKKTFKVDLPAGFLDI